MSNSFFNKNQRRSCAWCLFGKKSEYNDDVFCLKKGLVSVNDSCRRYKYDPLKRQPQIKTAKQDFNAEDFKL